MTKLDKPIRREINVDGKTYTLTIEPLGMKLAEKGHRNGTALTWKDLLNGDVAVAAALQASV